MQPKTADHPNQHAHLAARLQAITHRLHVSDGDGVLVPVKTDATKAHLSAENLAVFARFAATHPVITLTGRAHAWELPQMMLGDAVTATAPDMEALLHRLPVPLRVLCYLHDHGQQCTQRGVTIEVPSSVTAAHKERLRHINEIGRLCQDLQAAIARQPKANPILREIFNGLHFTPQTTLLNINIHNLPPEYKKLAIAALEWLLHDANDLSRTPAEAVQRLQDNLLRTVPALPPQEPSPGGLPVLRDNDRTYLQLGAGRKGPNLLYWLHTGNFLGPNQHITLVADNFQPGGSDRELAEALIPVYGYRVHLWQSLDGGKQELKPDDPLRPYLEFVFNDCAAGFTFLNLLNTKTPADIAPLLTARQIPGVLYKL